MIGYFVQMDGVILKSSFCNISYAPAVGPTSLMSNPSLYY